MPTLSLNRQVWTDYDWSDQGESWAGRWGGSRRLWFGTLLPRLHPFLPAARVLEIAPGFGRMTQHLLPWADELIGIDLTDRCVNACRARFAGHGHVSFALNDGLTLHMIESDSIDFAFSWDSLVHAEPQVLESYATELRRTLKRGATAFIHHSNLGAYAASDGTLPFENPHFRDTGMTAELFRAFCVRAGLHCVAQELLSWGQEPILNDCVSLVVNDDRRTRAETRIVSRPHFMSTEASAVRECAELYTV